MRVGKEKGEGFGWKGREGKGRKGKGRDLRKLDFWTDNLASDGEEFLFDRKIICRNVRSRCLS